MRPLTYLMIALCLLTLACTRQADPSEVEAETQAPSSVAGATPTSPPSANEILCDKAMKFVETMDTKNGFKPFHDYYKQFVICHDAGISELYSGHVADGLVNNWKKLHELNKFFADAGFKKFFFQNIDAYVTSSEKDMETIIEKAKSDCPSGQAALCKELQKKAQDALDYAHKEMNAE